MLQTKDLQEIKEYLKSKKPSNVTTYKNTIRWIQVIQSDINFNKANPATILTLIDLCFTFNLNPVLKEVYLVPMNGGSPQIIIAYDALFKVVLKSGLMTAFDTKDIYNEAGDVIGVEVIIERKGFTMPTHLTYWLKEWNKGTKGPWETMPIFMLRKCAMARTLSVMFSDALDGAHVYTEYELWDPKQQEAVEAQKKLLDEANNTPQIAAEVEKEIEAMEIINDVTK